MEGTANPMDQVTTQIALFSRLCTATPLPEDEPDADAAAAPGDYKLSFEGCGVSHGVVGVLFAVGLREQCQVIRQYVEGWVRAGRTVLVNFVGLSRGGIGGLYLAQELSGFDAAQVLLNLLLFDPVPGNFVWVSRFLDLASLSNANLAMDVSHVGNLGRVVVLYPHEPLPALAVHAPLLCKFPETCQLEQDVILGCHQGALFVRPQADTCLSFARIRDFLRAGGTPLNTKQGQGVKLDVPDAQLAELLARELRRDAPTNRCAHAPQGGAEIVRYSAGRFLNRSHLDLLRRLGQKVGDIDSQNDGLPPFMLDFNPP